MGADGGVAAGARVPSGLGAAVRGAVQRWKGRCQVADGAAGRSGLPCGHACGGRTGGDAVRGVRPPRGGPGAGAQRQRRRRQVLELRRRLEQQRGYEECVGAQRGAWAQQQRAKRRQKAGGGGCEGVLAASMGKSFAASRCAPPARGAECRLAYLQYLMRSFAGAVCGVRGAVPSGSGGCVHMRVGTTPEAFWPLVTVCCRLGFAVGRWTAASAGRRTEQNGTNRSGRSFAGHRFGSIWGCSRGVCCAPAQRGTGYTCARETAAVHACCQRPAGGTSAEAFRVEPLCFCRG